MRLKRSLTVIGIVALAFATYAVQPGAAHAAPDRPAHPAHAVASRDDEPHDITPHRSATPPQHTATPPHTPDVAAIVNGVVISTDAVDARASAELAAIATALADARVRQLQLEINQRLLNNAARRAGLTPAALLLRDVHDRVADPTDADARAYYDAAPPESRGDWPAARDPIKHYLRRVAEAATTRDFLTRLRRAATITSVDPETLRSARPDDPHRVLATVNAEPITVADLRAALTPIVEHADQRAYRARRKAAQAIIDETLIAQQALLQGLTPDTLIAREVNARTATITEFDARRFYDRNPGPQTPDVRTPDGLKRIMQSLTEQERSRARADYTASLRARAAATILLRPPPRPIYNIDTTDQPSLGPIDAPISIVAFVDYQCSSCAWLHEHLQDLMTAYPNTIRITALDCPLDRHPHAYRAAIAAEAARAQGLYWEYTAQLFEHRSALSDEFLTTLARRMNLDMDLFHSDITGTDAAENVQADRITAMRLGVDATPAVFIDGRRIPLDGPDSVTTALRQTLADLKRTTP